MPRKTRIHVPGAFYHVTLRGNHRQDIFFCDDDRRLLNGIVAEVIEQLYARVHAFCWMSNHVHLLIQVSDTPLWRIMLRIASRYARQVQRRFHTTGHLFECRYHAVLVDADEYLLTLIRYIHLNPVDARMVANADAYAWSSHHNYTGSRRDPWVTTEFALGMLHRDGERARELYRRLLDDRINQPSAPYTDELNPNDRRILGCDTFVAHALGWSWQPKSHKTVEQVIDEACKQFSVTRVQLFALTRSRRATHARAWITHQVTQLRIASVVQIARLFGRDESALRRSVLRYFPMQ